MGWLSTKIVYLWFQITKFPPFDFVIEPSAFWK